MKLSLIGILRPVASVLFGKVIGLDSIPPERREEIREKAWSAAEMIVEAAAKGAVEGAKNG